MGAKYIYIYFFFFIVLQKKTSKPVTESEQIHDEIERQVGECDCSNKFEVTKVGEGKYRVSNRTHFVSSEQLSHR